MSNVGKSYWAPQLESFGYKHLCVDDEIEKRLGPYLVGQGYKGIADVSRWMGQPFDERHKTNSPTYLHYETEIMTEVIDRIRNGEKLIVDTTGSVIYVGEEILLNLKEVSIVVLLDAPETLQAELYKKYLSEPKPVLWGGNAYEPLIGGGPLAALGRCYRQLFETRNAR